MHPLKPLGLLTFPPLFHASLSTCRLVPALQFSQCSAPWIRSQFLCPPNRASYSSSSPSNVTYRIGAAFVGKGRTFTVQQNVFAFEPTRQTPNKPPFTGRPASGQDAFFVSSVGNGESTAFGLADGVGGWAESGIDPSDFSHGLCHYMAHDAIEFEEGRLGARQLLERGFHDVVADEDITGGGSTACVAVGDSQGYLEVAK